MIRIVLSAILALQPLPLEIRVISGEGAVHRAGSRGSPGLVVEIVDALGKPVSGAYVSFRLPDDGASGVFVSGLASEIVVTGADGRAAAPPVRWNNLHGALEIRVTAASEGRRAGAAVLQHLAEAPARARRQGVRSRWLVLATAAAVGAGVGVASSRRGAAAQPTAPTSPGVEIGAPTWTIGKP